MIRPQALRLAICALLLTVSPATQGQQASSYPERPVRLVLAFQAGSYFDTVARLLAERLSAKSGARFFVENRPGANGAIGTQFVARSAPDGHTLLFVSIATHGINPALYKNLPYDALKDFAPISLTMRIPHVVAVRPSLPVSTLNELAAYARVRPGQVNYASAGIGTAVHLASELFARLAGVQLFHVPYNGSPAAVQSLLADENALSFLLAPTALPYLRQGQLKALAVTAPVRSQSLPDVPTSQQAGFPGLVATAWGGMVAPAGTSALVVEQLAVWLQEIAREPVIRKHFLDNEAEPVGSGPEEFRTFMIAETLKWRGVVEQSKISVE